jgi:hypothetical protein
MHYYYRWYYAIGASFFICFIGILFDIQPCWLRFQSAKKTERELIHTLQSLRLMTKESVHYPLEMMQATTHSAVDLVLQLTGLIKQSGAQLVELNSSHSDFLHAVVSGNYHQLVAVMAALPRQPAPMLIGNFSFRSDTTGALQLMMDVAALKHHLPIKHPVSVAILRSPFCFTEQISTATSAIYTLASLKMVGFLQQDERAEALFKLPTGSLFAVRDGMQLGKEQARVIDVRRDAVRVRLQDGRIQLFNRDPS